jgi:hypothetical protein
MKKIIVLFLLILLNINIVFAEKNEKNYSVHFNGSKFELLYSVKNKDFGGYLNEYYKKGNTYNIWSELIAVHHFPNAYSPIDRIKDFKDYLGSMHVPSSLTFNDKKNTAMIDFIMISDHSMPVVIEFNIFKYEKSKKCGSIAIQYARRYTATTTLQIEAIKRDIEKNRTKLIKKVKKFEIPEIIQKDIDKCISAAEIIEKQNTQKTEEKTEIAENKNTISSNEEIEEVDAIEPSKENNINTEAKREETVEDNKLSQTYDEENNAKKEVSKKIEITEEKNSSDTGNTTEEKTVQIIEPQISDNSTNVAKSEETIIKENKNNELEQKITEAPIPVQNTEIIKNNKKKKSDNYELSNDKNDYIAVPRTKKELKEEVKAKKQKQKDMAKKAKIQAKTDKKNEKINLKKQKKQDKINKKEAKKAEKLAKKPYTVSNNNSDLKAIPRTKKEIKANNKKKKREAKERVKQAKKKLNS